MIRRRRSRRTRSWSSPLLLACLVFTVVGANLVDEDPKPPSVGQSVWIRDLVLPGSELEAKQSDVTTPLVLRIADVRPHGTAQRYDLVFYGLDPGTYDLRDFLRRRDGTSTEDLPSIPVTVASVLPPGQVRPSRPPARSMPPLGGYGVLLILAAVAWTAGLVVIVARGRRARRAADPIHAAPATLADRLRPLIEAAHAGTLPEEDRAELELGLIAYWRQRLGLLDAGAAEAIVSLREHEEAGPLLRALEEWLHHPSPAPVADVGALLAPYRDLPAETLTEFTERAAQEAR